MDSKFFEADKNTTFCPSVCKFGCTCKVTRKPNHAKPHQGKNIYIKKTPKMRDCTSKNLESWKIKATGLLFAIPFASCLYFLTQDNFVLVER